MDQIGLEIGDASGKRLGKLRMRTLVVEGDHDLNGFLSFIAEGRCMLLLAKHP